MKFFNFKNSHTNDNIIYSKKDIANMTVRDAFKNQDTIMAQHRAIGVPSEAELQASPNVVYVHAYVKDDGTQVRAHWRSLPDTSEHVTGGAADVDNANNIINNGIEKFLDLPNGTIDTINRYKNEGFDDNNDMNLWEEAQDILYEKILHPLFPMSSEATINGMHDLKIAQKDKNAFIYDRLDSIGNPKNINILKSLGAKDSDKGILYNEHSKIAQDFKNSPELESHLANIRNKVLNGEPLPDIDIYFESSRSDFLQNNDKIDRHAFIHAAKMVDQKVDDKGIYTCKILDYSNFGKKSVERLLDIPNNWGYNMQERGKYKNFFIIVNIRKRVNW